MKTQKELRRKVLDILGENLLNPRPEVVSLEAIADRLKLSSRETRNLLLVMDQAGEIQSDMDGEFAIITPAGLVHLQQGPHYAHPWSRYPGDG